MISNKVKFDIKIPLVIQRTEPITKKQHYNMSFELQAPSRSIH